MEYFTFPMETMNITQNYTGTVSHKKHTIGWPRDYPIDCIGESSYTRSAIFATVDLKVTGKNKPDTTNTIWLQTVNPVRTPTFEDYAFIMISHWNDDDPEIGKWPVGSIVPKGRIICFEGMDDADANHFHIACGRGYANKMEARPKNDGSNKYFGVSNGDTKPPEEVMYIDPSFTTSVLTMGGINFKYLPNIYGTPVGRNNAICQVNVISTMQNAYSSAGGSVKGEMRLGIYNILQQSGEYVQVESGLWTKLASGKVVILEAEIIPSTLNAIPNTTIGNTVNITINKKTSGVTHTLRYAFGANNVTLATDIDSTYSFTPTKDLYYHMLNSKSAPMTIYCDTYKNGSLIGTTSTTFTVSAVDTDVKPDVSITTSVDTKTIELTNDDNTIITGITNLTYQLSSSLKYGARLNRYQIGDPTNVSDVSSNGVLEKISISNPFKYCVIDSREYNDWYTKEFNIVPYQPVKLSYRVVRENEKNLEEVTLHYEGEFYNAFFGSKEGASKNELQIDAYYQVDGENEWNEITNLNPTIVGNKYSEDVLLSMFFDKDTVYNFKVVVNDLIMTRELEKVLYDRERQFFDFVFPIGSIFIDFTSTDYSNYLGFIWEKTLLGKSPIGQDATQSEFNTVGQVGGSKYLQSHYHVFSGTTSQNGSHMHSTKAVEAYSQTNPSKTVLRPNGYAGDIDANDGSAAGNHTHTYSGTTSVAGSGNVQNLPPYEVVNFWKRIA